MAKGRGILLVMTSVMLNVLPCEAQLQCTVDPEESCDFTFFKKCKCDAACAQYGDCCLDAGAYYQEEAQGYSCVNFNGFEEVYMKNDCPREWRDPEVARRCEEGSPGNISYSDDPLAHLPVTSTITSNTYTNHFCATCNNDTAALSPWKLELSCDDFPYGELGAQMMNDPLDTLTTVNGSWGLYSESNGTKTFHPCYLKLQKPKNVWDRYCTMSVDKCAPDWVNEKTRRRCHSYISPVYTMDYQMYKNIDCAMCNMVNSGDVRCYNPPNDMSQYGPIPTEFPLDLRNSDEYDMDIRYQYDDVDEESQPEIIFQSDDPQPASHPTLQPQSTTPRSLQSTTPSSVPPQSTTLQPLQPISLPPPRTQTQSHPNLPTQSSKTRPPSSTRLPPLFPPNFVPKRAQRPPPPAPTVGGAGGGSYGSGLRPIVYSSSAGGGSYGSGLRPIVYSSSAGGGSYDSGFGGSSWFKPFSIIMDFSDICGGSVVGWSSGCKVKSLKEELNKCRNVMCDGVTCEYVCKSEPLIATEASVTKQTIDRLDSSRDQESANTSSTATNVVSNKTVINNNSTNINDTLPTLTGSLLGRLNWTNCLITLLQEHEYTLNETGVVSVKMQEREHIFEVDKYQIDDGGVWVCWPNDPAEKFSPVMGWVSLAGLGLSCLCLLLHLMAFALTPSLRNLPGWCRASLSLSLLVAYISFFLGSVVRPHTAECFVMSVIMYYCLLVSLFWMKVMAFDVWWSLRMSRKKLRVSGRNLSHRFLAYSLYAWLMAAIPVLVAIVLDLTSPDFLPPNLLPTLGKHHCWFGQRKALLIFFGIPLFSVMILNVAFFIAIAFEITTTSQQTSCLATEAQHKKQLWLYLRLAVLMGFTWISGIVAGYLQMEAAWYIFVIFNTLQGVFIFLAFTCRTRVWRALLKVWRGQQEKGNNSPHPDSADTVSPSSISSDCSASIPSISTTLDSTLSTQSSKSSLSSCYSTDL